MNEIAKLSESYSDKPLLQALLSLVPGWTAADILMQQRVAEIRLERCKTFFDELACGKIELTSELIEGEDFLHRYFSTVKAALNTQRREKIRLLARLLKAGYSGKYLIGADDYEQVLSVLDELSHKEFLVLSDLHKIELSFPPDNNKNDVQNVSVYWGIFRELTVNKHAVPEDEFLSFMVRMQRTGLYLELLEGAWDYKGDMGRTTPLFRKLLKIIESKDL